MRKIIFLSAVLSLVCPAYGQLTVSRNAPYNSVNYLVRNVLLGGGVIVSNITYNGDDTAIGFFNGTNSNIGIDSGLIVTNSAVTDAPGPNNSPAKGYQWPDCSNHSDSDLAALIGDTYTDTHSAAIVEFDFIPYSDTVRFQYVFGSEEYPEFVGSPFNDVFGFFVSGPGISGPYSHNAENIALIPNTVTPVSINNLNCNTNYNYYVCNWPDSVYPCNVGCPTRAQMPYTTVQYDGFTVPLTATAIVQCGEQYHIKLAICNIGDCALGSAVFFKSGSFSSGGTSVSAKINFANDSLPNDTILYRGGCDSASLYFERGYSNQPDTIFIDTSGTASPGIDYNPLPDTVILANGVTGDTLNIHAFTSSFKGIKTIILKIMQRRCGILDTQQLTVYIGNTDSIKISQPPVKVCYGDSVLISPAVTGGLIPYVYKWSTGSTKSSIWVHSITPDSVFTVRVTGACSDTTVDTIHIVSLGTAPLKLTSKDTTIYCPDTNAIPLSVSTTGGQPSYKYIWSTGATTSSVSVSQFASKVYTVKVYDSCNHEKTDTIKVTVVNPALNLSARDTAINCLDNVTLAANANGGGGGIIYTWSTGATSSSIKVKPNHDTSYIVTVYSPCGNQQKTDTVRVKVNSEPLTVTTSSTPVQCPGDLVTLSAQATGSGYISYLWKGLGAGATKLVHPRITTTYYVTVYDSCGNQSVTDTVNVKVPVIPAINLTVYPETFTICKSDRVDLYAQVTGGQSPLTYFWSSTGIFTDTLHNADSLHAYLIANSSAIYTIKVTDGCGDTTSRNVTVIVIPDCNISIPNVITPNNDGTNEYFYVKGLEKYPGSKLLIYNRWGKEVYKSDNYSNDWDGTSLNGSKLSDGVYYYILYLSNGKNYTGFIQLIR